MSEYLRARVAGGTYLFTVNTRRRLPILANAELRAALRHGIELVRRTRLFTIDAWVLLPDHLHCVWTLPEGDRDFPIRWAIIKRHVGKACAGQYCRQKHARHWPCAAGNRGCGNGGIGSTSSVMSAIMRGTWITCIGTR